MYDRKFKVNYVIFANDGASVNQNHITSFVFLYSFCPQKLISFKYCTDFNEM